MPLAPVGPRARQGAAARSVVGRPTAWWRKGFPPDAWSRKSIYWKYVGQPTEPTRPKDRNGRGIQVDFRMTARRLTELVCGRQALPGHRPAAPDRSVLPPAAPCKRLPDSKSTVRGPFSAPTHGLGSWLSLWWPYTRHGWEWGLHTSPWNWLAKKKSTQCPSGRSWKNPQCDE